MRPAEVIFSHQNTDFDALGSMLAVRRLYPAAAIFGRVRRTRFEGSLAVVVIGRPPDEVLSAEC